MRILGNNVLVEGGLADNINTMLIGAPGTGKTRSYVLPNLMSAEDETVVVLDPKGEIYDMTAPLMEEKGYRVLSLDFVTNILLCTQKRATLLKYFQESDPFRPYLHCRIFSEQLIIYSICFSNSILIACFCSFQN